LIILIRINIYWVGILILPFVPPYAAVFRWLFNRLSTSSMRSIELQPKLVGN